MPAPVTIDEILAAMENLPVEELEIIQVKLDELRELAGFEETPEMLAALDEGYDPHGKSLRHAYVDFRSLKNLRS